MKLSSNTAEKIESPPESAVRDKHIAPAPRVSIQAFCTTVETAGSVQAAAEDRRLVKAHLRVQMGGIAAAVEAYHSSPTPNVILIETDTRADEIIAGLDELAACCDEGTRVIVVGRFNDITLYRDLIKRGASDYLIAPVRAIDVVGAICGLFSAPDAKPLGRIVAIVGAKGGGGASTGAHNVGRAIASGVSMAAAPDDLDPAGAGSRQSAQREEPGRHAAQRAAERSSAVLLPQPGRRAEAAGDQAGRFGQGGRGRPARGHCVRAADLRHRRQ